MQNWTPTQTDIDWVGNLIKTFRDRGIWAIPRNGNMYVIDTKSKTATLTKGGVKDETHEMNKIVFLVHGYCVYDSEEQLNDFVGSFQAT